ncbi:OsmC family protein [Kineosporia rhizophila]|uniref:OsmC family protein n=1 Tax=Kineosporia TaxID=49184 RepID=UPI000B2E39FB|nr:OsmC family protein [Kineosporia sp. NBRC 101677]MCE0536301.1 OsmC family protein [Kineosporia rhizophila]GLY15113.1 hypothetical protein Kisp01_21280 [Kineosporia sp. NBRC 101677]
MTQTDTPENDLQITERIQPISVSTKYDQRFHSVTQIRDLEPLHHDEPVDLGGGNTGPTALEATLAAFNACSAMIMFVLRREQKFDLGGVEFRTGGFIDVRRAEMRRTKKKYSEIEPVARHYQRVEQEVVITTSEPQERIDHFKAEVERLCPMYALLSDAGVPLTITWTVVRPDA